jgi:hypothetical protein
MALRFATRKPYLLAVSYARRLVEYLKYSAGGTHDVVAVGRHCGLFAGWLDLADYLTVGSRGRGERGGMKSLTSAQLNSLIERLG